MTVEFPVPTLQTAFTDPLPALREAIAEYAWPSLLRHMGPDPESIIECMKDPKVTKPQPKPVPVHEPPNADEKVDEKVDEKADKKADEKADEEADKKADEEADKKADEGNKKHHWKHTHPQEWRQRKAYAGPLPLMYVPTKDYEVYANALEGYPARVKIYPGMPHTVKDFDTMEPGLLALQFGAQYMVPGGRFTSMYGWDSFFIILGLLSSSEPPDPKLLQVAISMLKQEIYEIENYGALLNANRSYFINRSQPPLLSSTLMVLLPYIKNDTKLVARATAAVVQEYDNVWRCGHRYDKKTGLSRYDGHPATLCRATEPGHYAWMKGLTGDARKRAESGHDTTARLTRTDACDMATVDLNCILYRIESNLAKLHEPSRNWRALAHARRETMLHLMYIPSQGAFFDYNTKTGLVDPSVLSATGVSYPLWCGMVDHDQGIVDNLVKTLMTKLAAPGGVVSNDITDDHRGFRGQWDWPAGWAPHQMLTWLGLMRLNRVKEARDLASRWVSLALETFVNYGCLPEKFDVVSCTSTLNLEYGNQCTGVGDFFGWTTASVEFALQHVLTEEDIRGIEKRMKMVAKNN
ncbi:alpha,alpha-trehalase nth1 [Perkinsus chesapeaki]|uniref:Trehalase n=1 Tax=Perkinsus chesapeaki TaxID=330153 RepID=A0A7J6MFE8_PERCH|nr:alpha,alpha-trehalase nth1 [Perkinsus chesapeaki]